MDLRPSARELRVIQRAYDLTLWEVPLTMRMPVPRPAVLGDLTLCALDSACVSLPAVR